MIDEHLFIEALALSAFEVIYKDPQPENSEKVSLCSDLEDCASDGENEPL
jgi:hypothetical protein